MNRKELKDFFSSLTIVILTVVTVFCVYRLQRTVNTKEVEPFQGAQVVAQTWGWGKVISKPVWIKSPDLKSEFGKSAWIFQVGFQMSDNKIRTAYYVSPNPLRVKNSLWNVGDEVEIVYVSGAGDESTPALTYFIIDHRSVPKETKKAPK